MANLKLTNAKLKSVAAFTAMMLATSNATALGLGSLEVQSNLDQPFSGEIELRVAPGDDLGSVVATIASREDFESLNIDYPSYLSDMQLSVDSAGGIHVLRVNSNGVVIKEPFIHFLVRVNWSGGSFLREYTALIDPPVYASETPTTIAQPRVVGIDESSTTSTPSTSSQVTTSSQVGQSGTSNQAIDAQYGPVSRGESLSQIAQDLQRRYPDLSIYQIMRVLFEENRSSFIKDNINGLMEGVVLDLADLNTIRSVDVAESRQFYLDQLNSWDPSSLVSSSDDAVKVGQDDYLYSEDNQIDDSSTSTTGNNTSTDTFQVGSTSDTDTFSSATDGTNQEGEVIALQQQVSDLQTSLSSSSLENQELKERISILEGQLADMNRLMSLSVEDADLASLEANLAEQNDASEILDEGVDSIIESANDFATSADESVNEFLLDEEVDETLDQLAEDSLLDDDSLLTDETLLADETLLTDDSLLVDDTQLVDDAVISDFDSSVEEVIEEPAPVEDKPAVVTLSTKPSFLEGLMGSGLWKILAAVLAAGLGLFFWRRRKADEEFEVSMMTIESHDTSIQAANSKSTVASVTTSVSTSDGDKAQEPSQNEETSFLTVYSDSDAVVQADEVDPIAEADVYIAYGRNEQAEEVLLDGLATHPERIDIKHKILSLYHKDSNKEGFERIAEELYAQKDSMDTDVWSEVCVMGKELLPSNPMFDMSASELFADTQLKTDSADELVDSAEVEEADNEKVDVVEENLEDQEDDLHLVNFEEEVSDLDQADGSLIDADNLVEIDLDEISNLDSDTDELEPLTESLVQEVSDLDIDADYDEARTQYELAKVFVDLGDEDGARKILNDIVDNSSNDEAVLSDAKTLLESIS